MPVTNDDQQTVSVDGDKKKKQVKDDEKEYIEIEDVIDEEYKTEETE